MQFHIIINKYWMRTAAAVKSRFDPHRESHAHCQPTSGSLLNQLERFRSTITDNQIRRRVFWGLAALEQATLKCLAAHEENPKRYVRTIDAV